MDIKSLQNQAASAYRPQVDRMSEAAERGEARTQENRAVGKGDSLQLSPEAILRAAARNTAMQTEDVRMERVEALKAQVADGTYKIDAYKIAAGLLSEETELFR